MLILQAVPSLACLRVAGAGGLDLPTAMEGDYLHSADQEGMDHRRWRIEHAFVLVPAQQYVGQFLATFQEFPASQKPGSFSMDRALEALQSGAQGGSR
jgi:hypothetical protein